MKRMIVVMLLLSTAVWAAPIEKADSSDFVKMMQILRLATTGLAGEDYRVVLAAEDHRASLSMRHWIFTLQRYPAELQNGG